MHFEREHDFAGTVERVASIMSDPAFQTALDLPDLARPDVVAHEVDGTAHRLTLRYEYIGQLDPIAQKVVGGRKLTWVQDLRIDVATGRRHARVLGRRRRRSGRRHRDGHDQSTQRRPATRRAGGVIDGDFRIRIPLIGGKAEKAIVPGLARRLDVEADAVAAELAR